MNDMEGDSSSQLGDPGANVHLDRVSAAYFRELSFDPSRAPSIWNIPHGLTLSGHQLAYGMSIACSSENGERQRILGLTDERPEQQATMGLEEGTLAGSESYQSDVIVEGAMGESAPVLRDRLSRVLGPLRTLGQRKNSNDDTPPDDPIENPDEFIAAWNSAEGPRYKRHSVSSGVWTYTGKAGYTDEQISTAMEATTDSEESWEEAFGVGSPLERASRFIVSKTVSGFNRAKKSAFVSDIKDRPAYAVTAGVLLAATQYADRTREPFVQASRAATERLAEGDTDFVDGLQNSLEAGGIAAAILTGSYIVIGEGVRMAVEAFPKTTEAFINKFPRVYRVSKYATAGIIDRKTQQDDMNSVEVEVVEGDSIEEDKTVPQRIAEAAKNGAEFAMDGVRRAGRATVDTLNLAGQGLTLGTAAQSAVSTMEGWSKWRSRWLSTKTAIAAFTLGVPPIVVGIDAGVDELVERGHYNAAENVVDLVSNRYAWWALAAVLAYSNYRANSKKIAEGEIPA